MIDFRFHLVSVVAVLLALGLGILMGSGLLSGPLLDHLERRLETLEETTDDLRVRLTERKAQLDELESFQRAVEPWLVSGKLADRPVVLFQFDGTEGALPDAIRDEIEERAGGRVSLTITLTSKLSLASDLDEDELALALDSPTGDGDALLLEVASLLGRRAAEAAASAQGEHGQRGAGAAQRFTDLLESLQDAGFVAVEPEEEPSILSQSAFVIAGGSVDPPPFDVGRFALALGSALGDRGATVVAAESSQSTWDLLLPIREDTEARDLVASVDGADTPGGRMALVLVLDRDARAPAEHYGTAAGATEVFPQPPTRA